MRKRRIPPHATIREELVRPCRHPECPKCTTGGGHGPYYKAYWREGARVVTAYIGSKKALQELRATWAKQTPRTTRKRRAAA
jgi:hypothetical protein